MGPIGHWPLFCRSLAGGSHQISGGRRYCVFSDNSIIYLGIVSKISLEIVFWLVDYSHGWILIGYPGITFIIFARQSVYRGRFSDWPISGFCWIFLTNQKAISSDNMETIPYKHLQCLHCSNTLMIFSMIKVCRSDDGRQRASCCDVFTFAHGAILLHIDCKHLR